MSESTLLIRLVTDSKTVYLPYVATTTAEDVCIILCKQIGIEPVARHLFALRVSGKSIFLMPSHTFSGKNLAYDFRIRFKVANVNRLKEIDRKAYDYYFHQVRSDVLENRIPDLIYEEYKKELVGLGVTDMYRVMLEKDIPREIVESDYKKYIPKEVIKRHSIFIKKPIHDALGKIKKAGHDAWYVKMEYLKQLEIMAPEYLAEEYKALTDQDGCICNILIKVSPYHPSEPGLRICYESKREEWHHVCTIEELCYISVRKEGTVEISRKNGIPFSLKFNSILAMLSFVSLLDAYYRLTCKWIFNLCKDVSTPSLQKLYAMKCHGPIGGEFSYAKLEEKRENHPGCFILRESETKYNVYYLDVCMKDSSTPKTFKMERLNEEEFIFNDDLRRYKNIHQLMAAYNDPQGNIYLHECLPPSEYDKSPLLLCRNDKLLGDSLTDSSAAFGILPNSPLCINSKDIQVYKVFANLTDLSTCKVSHLGTEYSGQLAKTESGVRCQAWEASNPIHKVDAKYTDDTFPERSRKKAKNYCRNPSRNPEGPWCYTIDTNLIDETCPLPLCSFRDCRLTGPGMEYGGEHNKGVTGRKCLKWNKARSKVKYKDTHIKLNKFKERRFPERDLVDAKKYCRNPDGDIAGPWCFVEVEDTDEIERDYCNIPFCDDQDCTVFSKNYSIYSHYTDFNYTLTNLTFGLKIWDSDSFLKASARLILSELALPLTGKQIDDAGIGIEILITNVESGLTVGNKDKIEYESSLNVLKSTEFTFFSLTWTSGFVSLTQEGEESKPLFLAEIKMKNNLLRFMKDKFNYYAFQGTNMLWSFPFCDIDGDCDVHTTTSPLFQQYWPLHETNVGFDLRFNIRAFHSALILLVTSPVMSYPNIKISLQATDNLTRIFTEEYETGPKILLKEIELNHLLDYWKWNKFSISIFADTLQIFWIKDIGTHMIIEIKHTIIRKMLWFSPSSDYTVAHWTFYCKPPNFANPPNAFPPECALNKNEPNYVGTQGITSKGHPCIPWSATKLLPEDGQKLFNKTEILKAVNYCRDPKKENEGTYCYIIRQTPEVEIEKQFCNIRKCKSAECKMAGTGNDYVGQLAVTRSNRTCVDWTTYVVQNDTFNVQLLNNTLYPDMSSEKAKNFCRNPSRSIAGSWCYTNDSGIRDICDVKDCNKPEECTILVIGEGEGRELYILPQWKEAGVHGGLKFALKEWNPDLLDGIIFEIRPLGGNDKIKLVIGADNNEKIVVYFNNKLKKSKTFTHIIPAGKWASFWLQIRKGEILLGYEEVPTALFEWQNDESSKAFEPVFLSYRSIFGNPIGLFFKCDDCHTEITSVRDFTKMMPIGLWSETESLIYRNLTLHMRGTGIAFISLMTFPEGKDYYGIEINYFENTVHIFKSIADNIEVLLLKPFKESVFSNNSWTTYRITFNENNINITKNNSATLTYDNPEPMLFYWFTVGAENGSVTWTANCDPPDIDGEPLNGGWSPWLPWHCTVSCGGGEGLRSRVCSNPRPNIFGKLCEGSHSSAGVCNDFPCGDISPDTLEKIHDHLQMKHSNYMINEGSAVTIENNHELLNIINKESPESYYEWTLNGMVITSDLDHIALENDDILIKNANTSDMGIYACMLYRINKERVIFHVAAVTVATTDDTIVTRATLPIVLKSNAVILGYIYSDLRQKWLLNDTVYIDHGIVTLAAVSTERVITNTSHNGVWKCVVEQSDLGLLWSTNLIKIKVKLAPNFYTHLMEDKLTAPIFKWFKSEKYIRVAIIFIIVFVCAIVAIGLYLYLKYCTLPTEKANPKKKHKRNKKK